MRILVIASSLGVGGAQRAAVTVGHGLQRRHSVSVMTFQSDNAYRWNGRHIDLGLPHSPSPGLLTKARRFRTKLLAVKTVLGQERPDVVLSFAEGPSLVAIMAQPIRHRNQVPVVAVAQSVPLVAHRGLYRSVYRLLGRAAYRRAAKLVSASAGVAEELARLYGLHREEIVVIPNPIDTGFVLARSTEPLDLELEILADVPILLTIGRLEKVKNHVLLLRAFARVRRETAANLLIVGTGGLRQNLERLAEDLGIAHDVVFQGWLDNPFPLMRMSTAFVLSSHYEGFGNVLLEAFACGCPVVSTDCPFGPAEILGDPAAGILVPAQDENALATAILRVLRDDGLRTALAHRGRHRALEFETSRVIARYERTLESLLSHSTSRS